MQKSKQTKINNTPESTTDYINNFVYEDEGTFELRYILTPEGRVMANPDGSFEYQYFLKDYLGNTRVTVNQTGEVIQEDSYYPFGMSMTGLNYETGLDYKNKYLYNGKELQNEFGLGWYDYGARFYDAVLGRWHVPDPLSEEYLSFSSYNYTLNNPIRFIDPNGMWVDGYIFNERGEFIRKEEDNEPDRIVIENSETGEQNNIKLHDPENDGKTLNYLTSKYGSNTQLVFSKSSKNIKEYINESGVKSVEAQGSPYKYAFNESRAKGSTVRGEGKMDNWASVLGNEMLNAGININDIKLDKGGFFIYKNTAYNAMDFGNALWGIEMMHLGFSLSTAKKAAHGHHFLFGWMRHRQGGLLDAKADQKAIEKGYNTFSTGSAGGVW